MSTSFVSLLPFLKALQRQQSGPSDEDDDNPGADELAGGPSQGYPASPAPPSQPGQDPSGPGTPGQPDTKGQQLIGLLQSGLNASPPKPGGPGAPYPSPPKPGGPGAPQGSAPKQARTDSDQSAQSTTAASGSGAGAASSFPRLETPSAEDIANGNYVKVGFRHLLRNDPGKIFFHTYVDIPVIENGKGKIDGKTNNPVLDSYGVLGNPNSANGENQQVRKKDLDQRWPDKEGNAQDRNSQVPGYKGKEVLVKVTPEQREALRQGMDYFSQQDDQGKFIHPCPVCGSAYDKLGPNSNEFIYNMLFWNPAGPIPAPKPVSAWRTPSYYRNDPNQPWYPNRSR